MTNEVGSLSGADTVILELNNWSAFRVEKFPVELLTTGKTEKLPTHALTEQALMLAIDSMLIKSAVSVPLC